MTPKSVFVKYITPQVSYERLWRYDYVLRVEYAPLLFVNSGAPK